MTTEQKVIAFLLQQDADQLRILKRELANVVWSDRNQEIFDLIPKFLELSNPDFFFSDYVSNEYINPEYIADLVAEGSAFSADLGRINIDKLIKQQEEKEVKDALLGLKDRPVNEVVQQMKSLKGVRPIKPLGLDTVRERRIADRAYEKIAPSTGYPSLDLILKGFVPGHVYVMTGGTNVGKSTIACNFAHAVAKQSKRVLYFALEPDVTMIEYLASIWSHKRFTEVTEEDLIPPPGLSIDVYTKEHIDSLEKMVQVVENSERYDLIIIDHFGYFISDGRNSNQAEKNAMKTMAGFAKDNKTAVLIIVHPRKPAKTSSRKAVELSLHDISGSAAFSQDATDVLVIARKKDPDDPLQITYTNEGYIAVHKTKSGGNGIVKINFIEGSALILERIEYASMQAGSF